MPPKGWKKKNRIVVDGDIAHIYLTKGRVAIIDVEDVDRVKQYTWGYDRVGVTTRLYGPARETLYLSRLLLFGNNHRADKRLADHRDHDILNNRKRNLRPATKQQNNCNSLPRMGGTSQYKGVCWNGKRRKWIAQISAAGSKKYLGCFDDEVSAAQTYNKAAVEIHGEFASLNFIKEVGEHE